MTDREIKVLDHGYVALVDVMGDDRTPARTARTSFRNRTERTAEEDARLTDYLVRNRHTTPIEFCQVRYYVKLPIFVARQFIRHRTASVNEVSYRYVQAAREFYVPAAERCQRKNETNKQGSSSDVVDDPERVKTLMAEACNVAFDLLRDHPRARPCARARAHRPAGRHVHGVVLAAGPPQPAPPAPPPARPARAVRDPRLRAGDARPHPAGVPDDHRFVGEDGGGVKNIAIASSSPEERVAKLGDYFRDFLKSWLEQLTCGISNVTPEIMDELALVFAEFAAIVVLAVPPVDDEVIEADALAHARDFIARLKAAAGAAA